MIAFWLIIILAPMGSVLLPVLAIGSLTARFGPEARPILKRDALVGAICAILMALVFVLEPDLSMPGPGNYALMLAAFMAGFAASPSFPFCGVRPPARTDRAHAHGGGLAET